MRGIRGQIDCARWKCEGTRLAVQVGQGGPLVDARLRVGAVCDVSCAANRGGHCRTRGISKVSSDGGSDCRIGVGARQNGEGGRLTEAWIRCGVRIGRDRNQAHRGCDESGGRCGDDESCTFRAPLVFGNSHVRSFFHVYLIAELCRHTFWGTTMFVVLKRQAIAGACVATSTLELIRGLMRASPVDALERRSHVNAQTMAVDCWMA